MAKIIDTNIWIDASLLCENIRNPSDREECKSIREKAREVTEPDSCFVTDEIKKEIKVSVNPKVAGKAKSLMKRCKPYHGRYTNIRRYVLMLNDIAKENRSFNENCRNPSDWLIIGKAFDLSDRFGEDVTLLSRDRHIVDPRCTVYYQKVANEVYPKGKVSFVRPY
jgi:hypothetical protein